MSHALNHFPIYNIKAVLMETGLSADVLRAWERRYDLPKPHRTQGGHRLYSEYDVETIKWLKRHMNEGLSISRAVQLWRELVEAGRNPLEETPRAEVGLQPEGLEQIERLRSGWLNAVLALDGRRAEDILNQAFGVYPTQVVCIEILQKGLNSIGEGWYHNQISVQQEHFASALAIRRLETLITLSPQPVGEGSVLLGCPPHERHAFPMLLLSLLLRRAGLNIVYLGDDIPIDQFEQSAAAARPNLIVLSAQQLTTASSLQAAMLALRSLNIPLGYGGLIFNRLPELRAHIPAHFLGETIEEASTAIQRLVREPVDNPEARPVDEAHRSLARLFDEQRALIEMRLLALARSGVITNAYLSESSIFFGNGLSAALHLGDLSLMQADLDWVTRLLDGRNVPAGQLGPFLEAYSQAVLEVLGDAGKPIVAWFMDYLRKIPVNKRV